jgi:MFS family permease
MIAAGALRLGSAFRAMRHREFRVYWVGQLVSVTGTWMQTLALGWLIYRLTDSPTVLGVLSAARFGPSLLGAPFAGVIADRFPRRPLVLMTQTLGLLQASTLAALTISGAVKVWQVLALAMFQGFVDTIDMPARQTLQVDLVGIEDLQSAVSLNASAFNAARIVGPAIAGVIVGAYGEGVCFVVNAVSFLAVLIALLTIRGGAPPPASGRSLRGDLAAGVRYAWTTPAVRAALLAVAVTSVAGLSYTTVLPVVARDVLGSGARGYGMLLAGAGVGAILGALVTAGGRGSEGARGRALAAQATLGVGLMAFGAARHLGLATGVLVVVGFAVAVQLSTTNGFLQTTAPPELRGRVISLYFWIFVGLSPIGGLAAGLVAERLGAPWTAVGAGTLCLLAATVAWLRSAAPTAPTAGGPS